MATKPLNTSQPPDLVAAIREQCERDGMKISEWVAECCIPNLDRDLRKTLGKRPPAHRPRKSDK